MLTGESACCEARRGEQHADVIRSAVVAGAKRPATTLKVTGNQPRRKDFQSGDQLAAWLVVRLSAWLGTWSAMIGFGM
jgi:hypothetical protein